MKETLTKMSPADYLLSKNYQNLVKWTQIKRSKNVVRPIKIRSDKRSKNLVKWNGGGQTW